MKFGVCLLVLCAFSITNLKAQELQSFKSATSQSLEKAQLINQSNPRVRNSHFPKVVNSEEGDAILVDVINGIPMYSEELSVAFPMAGANAMLPTSFVEMHNIDALWSGGSLSLNLSGEGQVIGHGEGIRESHSEFEMANIVLSGNPIVTHHGTSVAGMIGAAGNHNSTRRGASFASEIVSYNRYLGDFTEMSAVAASGAIGSNHSYGGPTAWSTCNSTGLKIWNSMGEADTNPLFGRYDQYQTIPMDTLAYANPYYTIVQSAGNSKTTGPAAGEGYHVIGEVTGTSCGDIYTGTKYPNGSEESYDTIVTRGTAKNIITVGMIVSNDGGYQGADEVKVDYRSSAGPTDDGRIKPEIVAVHAYSKADGSSQALFSPSHSSDTSYGYVSGTSAAAGVVTGVVGLLNEQWENLTSEKLRSSEVKAILINSAWESGEHDGPDYKAGYGVLNAKAAAETIQNDGGSRDFINSVELTNNAVVEIPMYSMGDASLKVTAVWTDPAGTESQPLVNDIDIRIRRESDGQIFFPWVLDPSNPSAPATTGDNSIDNVEQVYIENPGQESYTLIVSHKSSLISGNSSAKVNNVAHLSATSSQLVSIAISGQDDGSLPVEFDDFSVSVEGRSALIAWKTLSEINNAGFTIQHKSLSMPWEDLEFVEGNGNKSEASEYHFSAENLEIGVHQFRIRQMDFDGSIAYSEVLSASVDSPESFNVDAAYPNPFNPETTIGFAVSEVQRVKASLYNSVGQKVADLFDATVDANQHHNIRVDATNLPSGTYLVRLEARDNSKTERIVLMK